MIRFAPLLFVLSFAVSCASSHSTAPPPDENRQWKSLDGVDRKMELSLTDSPANLLFGPTPLQVSDMECELLAVFFVSLYCPKCKESVSVLNRSLELLKEENLSERIRFLAIATTNSKKEASLFQNELNCRFPFSGDPPGHNASLVGADQTPHVLLIRDCGSTRSRVVYSRYGPVVDPDAFLETLQSHLP